MLYHICLLIIGNAKICRSGKPISKPRWPVIILRTPKGWTGPKKVDGEFIEGSFRAHQVPLMKVKSDKGQLSDLQDWLQSYKPKELFDEDASPVQSILDLIPTDESKIMGRVKETYDPWQDIKVADWNKFAVQKGAEESSMKQVGKFLDQALQDNPTSIRIFSPDELISNKLDAVFDHTGRNFQWDEFSSGQGGRVIEILSEHCCQGFMQGYTLTGRVGFFPSYESFLGIIHTMMVQYAKFGKMVTHPSTIL
jgi:xylulose-5-phosphate/fructose-6-phosphate phosphoketolase